MRRDTGGGILLITGALAGVFALALHPTGHDLLASPDQAGQAARAVLVHAVALAGVPMLFLGLLAVARRLGPGDLTAAALVAYGFAGTAVMSAAVASGFVAPPVTARLLAAQGAQRDVYHALFEYTGLLNQGYAKVYLVASCVSMLLWGAAILRRRMGPAVGWAGVLIALVVLLGFFAGHLRLDVHGFGMVTFAQSAWLAWLGVLLLRPGTEGPPAPS
jgi:hypothetical protein